MHDVRALRRCAAVGLAAMAVGCASTSSDPGFPPAHQPAPTPMAPPVTAAAPDPIDVTDVFDASLCASEAVAPQGGQTRFGALEFIAGARIEGRVALGGLSGLYAHSRFGRLSSTNDRAGEPTQRLYDFTVVSDRARLFTLTVEAPVSGGALRLACWNMARLPALGSGEVDPEGAAPYLADPSLHVISFEREHRIEIVDPADPTHAQTVNGPSLGDVSDLGNNTGLEALAALPSGTLVAGAESPTVLGRPHPVWRFAPTGDPKRPFTDAAGPAFRLAAAGPGFGLVGFDVTPDGDLLVLERFYAEGIGNAIAISRVTGDEVERAAGLVRPQRLARLSPGSALPVDNFEGIAVNVAPDGRTLVWIVSDDNFSDTQETLLYVFAVDESALGADMDS